MPPAAAAEAYAALKEFAELVDLAARHGWRLDRSHEVDNEVAWEQSGRRVVVALTATAGLRRCGAGHRDGNVDPLEGDWIYDANGEVQAPEGRPVQMLFWDRRSAGEVGLAGLVRRWFSSPPGVGVGDLILAEGQWSPVIEAGPGHVRALQDVGGRVRPVTIGWYEVESRRFARPVDELTAEMEGRWLVISQGSTHLWDLDNMAYRRFPGATSASGGFPHDAEPMPITRVDRWPAVGSTSMVWFDDPARPETREHWRQSSIIDAIVSASAMGEEAAVAEE